MSKALVTKLFISAVGAVVIGVIIALGAFVAALASGAVTIGGPSVVTVNGAALAGSVIWFIVGGVLIAAGELAAIGAWIGALLNTSQLDDKTWFLALLVLGVFSLGWIAMVAYVFAGPDSTRSPRQVLAA
jgi:hypothetical protein